MDKIIITDLTTVGIIGVKKAERENPQEILINCTLFTDVHIAGQNDSILDTINYSTVSKTILACVAETNFYTVEALSEYISKKIFEQFNPKAIRLKVEKTQAVKAAKSVGVEIFRYNRP